MAEAIEQASLLSLRGSDSGLTVVNTDAVVRKYEQQERLIEGENVQISELEKIEDLQKMVETFQFRQVMFCKIVSSIIL